MRTLLAYGDSNTHGTAPMTSLFRMERFGPETRWPGVAAASLAPGWRVVEEGLPGRTTLHPDPISGVHKNGLAHLPAALESHAPIDLVALMLGTNDCKARFAVPAIEIAVSVEKLVLAIRQSFAGPGGGAPAVLLIAPVPVSEAGCFAEVFAGGAAKSRALGTLLAEAAERQGTAFLDAGRHAAVDPADGIHLDARAHAALGHAVADAVRALEGSLPC